MERFSGFCRIPIEPGRDLSRSPVQPPAHNRGSTEARLACFFRSRIKNLRKETAQPLWATCATACLSSGGKKLFLARLILLCFSLELLCLVYWTCRMVKSSTLFPSRSSHEHWGLLLDPPEALLQVEQAQLSQPLFTGFVLQPYHLHWNSSSLSQSVFCCWGSN